MLNEIRAFIGRIPTDSGKLFLMLITPNDWDCILIKKQKREILLIW